MENIFTALRKDHEVQRGLLDKLKDTSGDSYKRRALLEILEIELKKHAKFEERFFYRPMMDSDLIQEKIRHSISEHHDIDEKLKKVKDSDFSSPGWLVQLKDLRDKVTHHLDEEEQEVFQMAGKVLTEAEKKKFAKKYEEAFSNAEIE